MHRILTFIAATSFALGAAGAAAAPEQGTDADTLSGTSWVLAAIDGTQAMEEATLIFGDEGDSLGGNGGCNTYGGDIAYDDDGTVSIGSVFSTMMACDETIMAQERAMFSALEQTETLSMEDGALVLTNADGFVLAEFLPGAPGDDNAPDQ